MNNNFFKLLNEELNKEYKKEDNLCLISHEPLEDNCIKLECNHSFNYEPLFNEVCNQKLVHSKTEIQKLLKNQIKCPYCRNVQFYLLPPRDGFLNIKFVNFPLKYCMKLNNCSYKFKRGKNKGIICNKQCIDDFCSRHATIALKNNINLINEKLKTKQLLLEDLYKKKENYYNTYLEDTYLEDTIKNLEKNIEKLQKYKLENK